MLLLRQHYRLAGKVVHLLLQEGRGLLLLVMYEHFLLLDSPTLLPLVGVFLVVMPEPLFFLGLLLGRCVSGMFAGVALLSLNYLGVVLESLMWGPVGLGTGGVYAPPH